MDHKQHPAENSKRFESDIKRLFRKHLSDPNHIITDEELAGVRVGINDPENVPADQSVEDRKNR